MKTYRIALFLFSWLMVMPGLFTQAQTTDIQVDELKQYVTFLASDDLKGRYPGTDESREASQYIRDHFLKAGLTLLGTDGYQTFDIVAGVEAGGGNYLEVNRMEKRYMVDYAPFSFSEDAAFRGQIVFCGYGLDVEMDSLKWNNYEYTDVTGKWVLILRGYPGYGERENPFEMFGDDRQKVLTAKDKGAAGVLLVTPPAMREEDTLEPLRFDKTTATSGIPLLQVTRATADEILQPLDMTVAKVEEITGQYKVPMTMPLSMTIEGKSDINFKTFQSRNVVGMIEGTDLKDEYIIVGAHYDHLGMGGPGSGSRAIDTIAVHNGADDNASGVAGVMAIARSLAADTAKPRRSIVFVAFAAEELGLKGSKYFVENALFDLASVKAMVNFDMIGRMKSDSSLMIGGTGTSQEAVGILTELNAQNLKLGFSPDGYGPSDHAAFYAEDIPVFFVSTGAHTDYHTPADDTELINFEGQQLVTTYSRSLVNELANRDGALTFMEAGPKERQGGRMQLKVTLGIMPDFTGGDDSGLRVDGVRPEGPAAKGGMLKGDVIVAMNGMEVRNIYDYMNRLKRLSAGELISVDVIRDGEQVVLLIQL